MTVDGGLGMMSYYIYWETVCNDHSSSVHGVSWFGSLTHKERIVCGSKPSFVNYHVNAFRGTFEKVSSVRTHRCRSFFLDMGVGIIYGSEIAAIETMMR